MEPLGSFRKVTIPFVAVVVESQAPVLLNVDELLSALLHSDGSCVFKNVEDQWLRCRTTALLRNTERINETHYQNSTRRN